jgi:hypothetical protein
MRTKIRRRSPSAKAPSTDPRAMARVLWWLPLVAEDDAVDEVAAAPASEAELINLDDGLTDIEVIDLVEDIERLLLEEVLELDVEVAVFWATEARIDVTSV